jgi:hypothetical protein
MSGETSRCVYVVTEVIEYHNADESNIDTRVDLYESEDDAAKTYVSRVMDNVLKVVRHLETRYGVKFNRAEDTKAPRCVQDTVLARANCALLAELSAHGISDAKLVFGSIEHITFHGLGVDIIVSQQSYSQYYEKRIFSIDARPINGHRPS